MTTTVPPSRRRASRGVRRFGYAVSVGVNAALLYAVNRWPGWEEVPLLTDEAEQVVGWLNVSLVVGIVANLFYLVADPRWLKALGDVVTTTVGIVVLVRFWQVFPFDVEHGWSGWGLVLHSLLIVAIAGSVIGVFVALGRLFRAARGP